MENYYFRFETKFSKSQIVEFLFKRGYIIRKIKIEYTESVYHNSTEDLEKEITIPCKDGYFIYCQYGKITKSSYENLDVNYLKNGNAVRDLFEYLFTQQLYNSLLNV